MVCLSHVTAAPCATDDLLQKKTERINLRRIIVASACCVLCVDFVATASFGY